MIPFDLFSGFPDCGKAFRFEGKTIVLKIGGFNSGLLGLIDRHVQEAQIASPYKRVISPLSQWHYALMRSESNF